MKLKILYNLTSYSFKYRLKLNHKQSYLSMIFSNFYSTNTDELKEYNIPLENIRNFCIIAHIDHGKSTLADRLLEITGAIKINSGMQVLDKLQVEKERGITVKAQTVSLKYMLNNKEYQLNLIDTPGHVDFSSEVHRSLAACQGVLLVVDANDGVQAQTVANYYLAHGNKLKIIPIINKIDLKNANPEKVEQQLSTIFGINGDEIIKISAKHGTYVDEVLKAVVERIPKPTCVRDKSLKVLIFDSWYDSYRGAVLLVYIKDGIISTGDRITSCNTGKSYEVKLLLLLRPEEEKVNKIYAGQVGCIICKMKYDEASIGDTLYLYGNPVEPLPGFNTTKPMVYAGVYPVDSSQYHSLKNAMDKLTLNDNAVSIINESSPALGQGWRLGFLGLLHMEVFSQRLEQEFDTPSIFTTPGVVYKAKIFGKKNITHYKSDEVYFCNPSHIPNISIVKEMYEPTVLGTIITPGDYYQSILHFCLERRGIEKSNKNIDESRIILQFILPLNEIITDFHDELKRMTSGYASFDYEDYGYQLSDIAKMEILLNGRPVEELSTIVNMSKSVSKAKKICAKLLNVIPRQQFLISIQARIGSKILARENLPALRKDVTAHLYGGDVTRRIKLLQNQAQGKKKMRMIGNIALPRKVFVDLLKT
ncbi:PREDICTED: translation factor GUF1 homolog, mitochondrial [Ceratosolen solmsi marchali]|uniref:Translation factor GUF1 homolog, mitochondrial n=1 Tax=Ceratosolen solmsi marchali TaxID=326594 RepID=A0AAJ6YMC9_9HYME|nr:PREDICTED: translation factor GUF1 homolog, mitochondrial [Ceratosolen solmsi marchali]